MWLLMPFGIPASRSSLIFPYGKMAKNGFFIFNDRPQINSKIPSTVMTTLNIQNYGKIFWVKSHSYFLESSDTWCLNPVRSYVSTSFKFHKAFYKMGAWLFRGDMQTSYDPPSIQVGKFVHLFFCSCIHSQIITTNKTMSLASKETESSSHHKTSKKCTLTKKSKTKRLSLSTWVEY